MDGWILADGYWLLTRRMNESANAILGRRSMTEIASDPKRFMQEFHEDLKARLEQNNIPVEIESIELHGFNTIGPTRVVAYEVIRTGAANKAPEPK